MQGHAHYRPPWSAQSPPWRSPRRWSIPVASHGTEAARTAPASALTAEEAISQIEGEDGVLRFEVAEDASRFVWAGGPVLTDGLPADSTPYVTQGYLYPWAR